MKVKLAEVSRRKELQVRLNGVNPFVVEEYELALQAGNTFPPLVVFQLPDGTKVLADGFHRFLAYRNLGVAEVEAELKEGTYEDALDYTRFESNRKNGQRLSRADLWAVVESVLADPRYANRSDQSLSELCKCDRKTVAAARLRVGATAESRLGDDGKVRRQPEWRPPVDLNRDAPPAGPEAPEDGGRGALARLLVQRLSDHTTDLELSAEKLLAVHNSLDQATQKEFAQAVKQLAAVCGQLCVLADAAGEPAERQTVGGPL